MKKAFFVLAALLLMAVTSANAQQRQYQLYGIGFYNLENLFDTCHDAGHNDYEYLPDGTNRWTGLKYSHKLRNMAQVLSEMGTDRIPIGCAAIGVSEVENAKCLTDLCEQEPLKARNMQFVHVEGPDQRGVDCALIYNPGLFQVTDVNLVPYVYVRPEDSLRASRGFLTVKGVMAGENVAIIVNHLPSRFAESFYREEGGRQIREVKEQLLQEDPGLKLFIKAFQMVINARLAINKIIDDVFCFRRPNLDFRFDSKKFENVGLLYLACNRFRRCFVCFCST